MNTQSSTTPALPTDAPEFRYQCSFSGDVSHAADLLEEVVPVDVTFGDVRLPDGVRAGIAAVLRRIPADGAGSWPAGVSHVHVDRLLQGGQGGASVVAQLLVHRGAQRLVRVVKCGLAEEMAQEWTAYAKYVEPYTNILCTHVEAASPGAVNLANAMPGEFECVVYDHVAQHAGEPDQDVVMLQEVARAAYRGNVDETDRCETVVTALFGRAHQAFYNRYTNEAPSLRAFNRDLGPDLVLEVDTLCADGCLSLGTPTEDEYRAAVRYPDQVSNGGDLETGAMVALNDLAVLSSDGLLVGGRDDVVVEVRGVPDAFGTRHPVDLRFAVYGRVVETRAKARWDRLVDSFGDLGRVDGGVEAHGVATADPFAVLPHVLDHRPYGRVHAVVHGDMNVRNVLLMGRDPYLIDYARTRDDRPLLTDFAWLELGLMRDAFAGGGYGDLVRLQRWLALACRLLDAGVPRALDMCLPLLTGEPERAAFRILFALRDQARECARKVGEQDWWPAYMAQLVFAAHRTFKWPDDWQGDGALQAGFAVAAVAAEWLPVERPFQHWPDKQLTDAFEAVGHRVAQTASSEAVALALLFVSELDGRDTRDVPYEQRIERMRMALVRTWLGREAERVVAETEDRVLIGPWATPVTWPPNADEPMADGDSVPVLSLAADAEELVLLGGAGAGKTAVARKLRRQLALDLIKADSSWRGRAPVLLLARDIARLLQADSATTTDVLRSLVPAAFPADVLTVGAAHLIVDGLDELTPRDRAAVVRWLVDVRAVMPRVPVLVCVRPQDHHPDALPFPAVLLDGLDPGQVEDHVIRLVASGDLTPVQARMILDFPWLGDGPEKRRTPGSLDMLTMLARSDVVPRSVAEMDTVAAVSALRLPAATQTAALTALEAVAEHLLETAAVAPVTAIPAELLEPLRSVGLLRRSDLGVWFVRDHQRDYFAARALLEHAKVRPGVLAERAVRPVWHEPCRILVSLPAVPETIIARLVDTVMATEPERAGRLLGEARVCPPDVARGFVAARRVELAAAETASGAARALVAYGGPEAIEALHAVAVEPTAPDHARIAALEGLARCSDGEQRHDGGLLGSALHAALLDGGDPVRAFAARTVARTRTAGFELMLAELVDPSNGWVVCDAAEGALCSLGVHVPPSVLVRYHAACQARLLELEHQLPTLVTNREVLAVQQERVRVLERLASPKHVGLLLARRLDFEVGDTVAVFVEGVRDRQGELNGADATVQLLTGGYDPERWLVAVRGGDRGEAGAALHRLLRDAPELAGRLLDDLGDHPSRNSLCALAAAVPHLDPVGLERVERVYERLLPVVGADRLDGLSAMVRATYQADRLRGVRMAWLGAVTLIERQLPERLCWPWQRALSLSRGTPADLDELLSTGGTSADLAVTALASFDFHRDGSRGPEHRFSPAARWQLLVRHPGGAAGVDDVLRWTLAVATASLDDALPGLLALAGQADGRVAHPVATNRYGLVHRAPLADVLTAIGWLARKSDDAHEFLRGLDTSGMHDSVHTGLLVALAYLGDGTPLMLAVGAGDPVVEAAAHNAVRHWLPGPCSPPELSTTQAVKDWLTARLATPGLATGERRTLVSLLAEAEHRVSAPSTSGPR
jgi:hypothetical protein